MSRKVKEVIRAAGLRDELSFTSFRHGGFTEALTLISVRCRNPGARSPPVRQGAAALRQADHEAGGIGTKKRRAIRVVREN